MSEQSSLYAGAGRAEICFGDGYFPTGEYDAQHDALYARALCLESGEERIALVSLELPSLRPWEYTDECRALAGEIMGTDRCHTWICMTHDLSAPHVPPLAEKIPLHMEAVRRAVSEASHAAVQSLRPAVLKYGEGQSYVNSNRDVQSADGWWVGISDAGPSDKTLQAICLMDPDGGMIAVLYSYALKNSCLEGTVMSDGKRYVSSEVSGYACRMVEEDRDTVAIFLMSGAGDQVPREKSNYLALDAEGHFKEVNLAEQGYDMRCRLGKELGADVLKTVEAAEEEEDVTLAARTEKLILAGQESYPGTLPPPPVLSYAYPSAPDEVLELSLFRIGQTALIGCKSEITTPIFAKIREQSPFAHTMMGTLLNGGQGYVATDWDYDRFTYPALHSPFARGADGKFIPFVKKTLEKLKAETD